MAETLGQGVVEVTGDASGAVQAISQTENRLGASIFIFRTAGYALQSIGQSALNGFKVATTASADFNAELVKAANFTTVTDLNLQKVHDTLLNLASVTSIAPQQLAEGFYYAASLTTKQADALALLTEAAKASAAGLGDVNTLATLGGHIMNLYGLSAGDAAHIFDVLSIAVKEGAVSTDALSSAYGRILPIARIAGISFEDMAAAVSTATRAGLSADEAVTAIRQAIIQLIGPTTQSNKELATLGLSEQQISDASALVVQEMQPVVTTLDSYGLSASHVNTVQTELNTNQDLAVINMRKYGLTTDEINKVLQEHASAVGAVQKDLIPYGLTLNDINSVLRAYSKDQADGQLALEKYGISAQQIRDILKQPDGLYNALELIMKATGGNEAELRKMFPNIRALIGILATAGTQGVQYNNVLQMMTNSTGTLDNAFNKAAQTQAFAQQKAQAALEALQIQAGEALAPALLAFLKALTPILQGIAAFAEAHPKAFQMIVEGLMGIGAAAYILGGAMQAIAGGIAIFRAFSTIVEFAGKIPFLVSAFGMLGDVFEALGAVLLGPIGIILALVAALAILLIWNPGDWRTKVWNALKAVADGVVVSVKIIGAQIGAFFSALGSAVQAGIHAVGNFFNQLGTAIHNALMAILHTAENMWQQFSSRPVYWITRLIFFVPGLLFQLERRALIWSLQMIGHAIVAGREFLLNAIKFFQRLPGEIELFLLELLIRVGRWEVSMIKKAEDAGFGFLQNAIIFFARLPKEVYNWLENVINTIVNWGDTLVTNAITTFKRFTDAVWTQLTGFDWGGLGRSILMGIINGILNLISTGKSFFNNIKNQFVQGFKDAFGISSPSELMAQEIGAPLVQGIIAGISRNKGLIRSALAGAIPSIPAIGGLSLSGGGAVIGGGSMNTSGLSIGSMVIQNPQNETDVISALRRAEYLKRIADRGMAPAVR